MIWHPWFESDPAVIYSLDSHLRLTRCNAAWDRFAFENNGRAAARDTQMGRNLMEVVPAELQRFYGNAFESVLRTGAEWTHVFFCSSPSLYRQLQMRILPASDSGFFIVNALVSEVPHELDVREPHAAVYQENGVVTLCCHCRRAKNLLDDGSWDWVPGLLEYPADKVSHGLCDFCFAYHYPGESRSHAERTGHLDQA